MPFNKTQFSTHWLNSTAAFRQDKSSLTFSIATSYQASTLRLLSDAFATAAEYWRSTNKPAIIQLPRAILNPARNFILAPLPRSERELLQPSPRTTTTSLILVQPCNGILGQLRLHSPHIGLGSREMRSGRCSEPTDMISVERKFRQTWFGKVKSSMKYLGGGHGGHRLSFFLYSSQDGGVICTT